MERSGDRRTRYQVLALVEALGLARSELATTRAVHEEELGELQQKLEAAKDCLAKYELNEGVYGQQLAKGYEEIDRLNAEVARLERERDDARRLLDLREQREDGR